MLHKTLVFVTPEGSDYFRSYLSVARMTKICILYSTSVKYLQRDILQIIAKRAMTVVKVVC